MSKADQKEANQSEPKKFFFMATALVVYLKDGEGKQRYVNILAELNTVHISKSALAKVHTAATQRVQQENGVALEDIRDVVISNITPLGLMTDAAFHASDA